MQTFNIVSSKSLEKQLKVVETRIQELQSEIEDLEKIRSACHTLLGTSNDAPAEASESAQELAPASPKKKAAKKASVPVENEEEPEIVSVIRAREEAPSEEAGSTH